MPRCAQTMLAMSTRTMHHIKLEAYPICYGIFSMPVNSSTLKEHTVLERFKQMTFKMSSKIK